MNEQRARELFLESHRGSLPADDATALRGFLATHPELQREFEELARTLDTLDTMPQPTPSPRLRAGVLAAIEAEKRAARKTRSVPPPPVATARRPLWFWFAQGIAGALLLAVGFVAGTRQVALSPAAGGTAAATRQELDDLRLEVAAMNERVDSQLLRQQQRPTNDRLRSVLASARLENPGDRVINELIGSLALDPSTNVRLTALEALYPHAGLAAVRAGVLALLPREQSPLVQVAMIDFLVAARDADATTALETISRNDNADRSVRDAAQRGLNLL